MSVSTSLLRMELKGLAGANTLLAYFHYCNKGIYPFSAECKDQDLQTLAELDDEALDFVRYSRQFACQHSKLSEMLFAFLTTKVSFTGSMLMYHLSRPCRNAMGRPLVATKL